MPDTPPPSPQPNPFSMPSEIGGFVIQRVLGAGGMATVYAALQKQPRRIVALKVIKPGVTTETALRRFKREVEILGKLRHPYIAQVFAAGTHIDPSGAEIPYFVMEYVPGAQTLLEHVSMHNLELRERLKLFVKVCAAVEHGHRAKVIHRDLKPGNILIDESGEPKIIDFGVAHTSELELAPGLASRQQTMHTEPGRLIGTLHYMSPEQVDTTQQDLDARCDVYALGVVLYKLTTGHLPLDLEAVPIYEAARMIREKIPRTPSEINPTVKGDLETIILKSLEKDRARRYSNAGSLGRDIVRYLAGKPIHGRRAGMIYRAALFVRRQRAAVLAGAIVCAAVLGAAGYVMWNNRRLDEQQRKLLAGPSQSTPIPPPSNDPRAQPPATEMKSGSKRADEPFVLRGHSGRIDRLMFSPDGRSIVSGGDDRLAIVWDLASRMPLRTFPSESEVPSHLQFCRDGQRLVSASSTGSAVIITDIANASMQRIPQPECQGMLSLAADSNADRIALGCADLILRVVSALDGRPLMLRGTTGAFTSCAFSADGTLLAAGSERGTVYVWRLSEPSAKAVPLDQSHDLSGRIAAMAFTPHGDRLTAVAADGRAMMWRIGDEANEGKDDAKRAVSFVAGAGGGELTAIAFDPTGVRLACLAGHTLMLWDLSVMPPALLTSPMALKEQLSAAAVAPDGRWWAGATSAGEVQINPVQTIQQPADRLDQ